MQANGKKSKKTKIAKREMHNRSSYVFLAPYYLLFSVFIVIPTLLAVLLSFTNFNVLQFPDIVGLKNYVTLITKDTAFMQDILPNTVVYAIIVGPGGYILSFVLAWALSQLHKIPRLICALIIYAPSLTGGLAISILWKIVFSGDQMGYLNHWLMSIGVINEPIIWLINSKYLLPIVIFVALWSSMGLGFLTILAGILNSDETLYEAAAIDGIKNRFQEVIYITIPNMKPQMLFAAVMSIVGAFQNGLISEQLAGNPSPNNASQLIYNHITDYGFLRYEMGYAAAISVVLLGIVWIFSSVSKKLFADKE